MDTVWRRQMMFVFKSILYHVFVHVCMYVCMYVQVTSVFKEYWGWPLADYIVTIAQYFA